MGRNRPSALRHPEKMSSAQLASLKRAQAARTPERIAADAARLRRWAVAQGFGVKDPTPAEASVIRQARADKAASLALSRRRRVELGLRVPHPSMDELAVMASVHKAPGADQ